MEPTPTPLPVDTVDVWGVAEALDDGSGEQSWWYDPTTGQVEMGMPEDWDESDEDDDPMERGLVRIESEGSRDAYQDMARFATAVGDRHARDLLERALEGRGAFRRFRDTLHEFADLVEPWRAYARACAEMRALEWLADEAHVDPAEAATATAIREATAAHALAAVGQRAGLRVDVSEIVQRLVEIESAIDSGRPVTLTRSGEPWATITPE